MGLDVDSDPGVFKLERSALRDGYHDIPDIDRRVFTRAENKKVFGRGQDSLATTLDIDTVVESYRGACSSLHLPGASARSKSKSKSKDQQLIDVRLSDDVGTYVCGFQYYVSMLEAQQKIGKKSVVFLHVPKLDYEGDIRVGVTVVEGLIKALVSVLQS
jgi:pyroglutamyl-peptidase